MNIKCHKDLLKKTILLFIVLFGFSFNVSIGASVFISDSQTAISSQQTTVSTATLIVTSPTVPVVVFTIKSMNSSSQNFRDKEIIESNYFSSNTKVFFYCFNSHHFSQGQYSLRLHVVYRVFRI
jgi:hypothetical protein